MDLIIDTWVWKTGFDKLDKCCLLLIHLFWNNKNDYLIFDQRGRISKEYENHLTPEAKRIFKDLVIHNKIKKISTEGIQIDRYLRNLGFDKDDHKFLEVSVALCMKYQSCVIISGDSDFVELRNKLENSTVMRSKLRYPEIIKPNEFLSKYYNIHEC